MLNFNLLNRSVFTKKEATLSLRNQLELLQFLEPDYHHITQYSPPLYENSRGWERKRTLHSEVCYEVRENEKIEVIITYIVEGMKNMDICHLEKGLEFNSLQAYCHK